MAANKYLVFCGIPFFYCESTSLRDAANGRLYMGSEVNSGHFAEDDYTTVASKEYNLATAENECKWAATEPEQGVFDFGPCDSVMNFTLNHDMVFRGHNLCWGDYNPSWVEALDTYDDLANALTNHIQQVVTHYGSDNVIAWDVVNEAISDNSTADNWGYKTSTWYPTVPDFVTIAFTTARDACPSCSLFYNDYSIASASGWMKSKSDAVYALVQQLLSDGVPIDGVGMQLHISMNFDDFDGIRENIQRLYDLGLQTHFTEIDVACGNYPDYDCPAWGDTEQQEQASVYQSLLEICLEEPGCTSFETWGFTDKYTWLTSEDGTDQHPLPFDENYEKKPAYDAMLDILTES